MKKKTKALVTGDMVRNILDGKYYPLEEVIAQGAGYIITLTPSSINGNKYYADYSDRHEITCLTGPDTVAKGK